MLKPNLPILGVALVAAAPALAHHPLAGMPMETFTQGFLSGIGHPVLGFDHLFFVALVGVAALFTGRAALAPVFFVAAMAAGVVLATLGLGLPMAEIGIVGSLLVLGYLVASGKALGLPLAAMVFGLFGLFHGTAFAGSILGQEGGATFMVIAGYLVGLAVIQYAIAVASGSVLQRVWDAKTAASIAPRMAGAIVVGVGLFLALETVEASAFAALGWS